MTPITSTRPPEGLFAAPRAVETIADLFANVWQFGYVTNDLDQALDELSTRFGFDRQFRVPSGGAVFFAGDREVPWEARFAMAARGGLIVEVIEPVAGEVEFYRQALPTDGSFAIRLHHVASFIETGDGPWDRLGGLLAAAGLRFDYTMLIPGRVRAGYIDARAELGHFLEVCQLEQNDIEFFTKLTAGA